jgi:hypothetical protein
MTFKVPQQASGRVSSPKYHYSDKAILPGLLVNKRITFLRISRNHEKPIHWVSLYLDNYLEMTS